MFILRIANGNSRESTMTTPCEMQVNEVSLPSMGGFDVGLYVGKEEAAEFSSTSTKLCLGKVFDENLHLVDVESVNEDILHRHSGSFLLFDFYDAGFSASLSQDSEKTLFFAIKNQEYIFSDSMSMLLKFTSEKANINWNYMFNFVRRGDIFSHLTPFDKIYEVPCGCRLDAVRSCNFEYKIKPIWNPLDYVTVPFVEEIWQEKFLQKMHGWIESSIIDSSNVILELSGGLDSSFLAWFLSGARNNKKFRLHAINFYNKEDANSDERKFAKMVADKFSFPLLYIETSKHLPFSFEKFFFKPERPNVTFNYLALDTAIHQKALSIDSNYVLVSGHGGDSLFFSVPPIEAIADSLLLHAYKLAVKKSSEISTFYPNYLCNIINVTTALFRCIIKENLNLFKTIPPCTWLDHLEPYNNYYDYLHPFFSFAKTARMLPGKAAHIENYYVTLASCRRQLKTIYPFLSQPIVESALAMPTYESFDSIYSRILIRKLFERVAGPSFSYRKTKGHATASFFNGVRKNYKNILTLCMEGKFAKEQFVNKKELYDDIGKMWHGVIGKSWYISNLFCAEMFLNEWTNDI